MENSDNVSFVKCTNPFAKDNINKSTPWVVFLLLILLPIGSLFLGYFLRGILPFGGCNGVDEENCTASIDISFGDIYVSIWNDTTETWDDLYNTTYSVLQMQLTLLKMDITFWNFLKQNMTDGANLTDLVKNENFTSYITQDTCLIMNAEMLDAYMFSGITPDPEDYKYLDLTSVIIPVAKPFAVMGFSVTLFDESNSGFETFSSGLLEIPDDTFEIDFEDPLIIENCTTLEFQFNGFHFNNTGILRDYQYNMTINDVNVITDAFDMALF